MTSLDENTLLILRVMRDNSIILGNDKSIREIIGLTSLSLSDFDLAETYLLQSGYITGAGGGLNGSRWITPAGIDYLKQEERLSQFGVNLNVGEASQLAFHFGTGNITQIQNIEIGVVLTELRQWLEKNGAMDSELVDLFEKAEQEPTENNLKNLLSKAGIKSFEIIANAGASIGLNLLLQFLLGL